MSILIYRKYFITVTVTLCFLHLCPWAAFSREVDSRTFKNLSVFPGIEQLEKNLNSISKYTTYPTNNVERTLAVISAESIVQADNKKKEVVYENYPSFSPADKREAFLIEAVSKIKKTESPYTMQDYQMVRDLLKNNGREIQKITNEDAAFKENVAAIFSEFQNRDNNKEAKKTYQEFYNRFQEEKTRKFSVKKTEPPLRTYLDETH